MINEIYIGQIIYLKRVDLLFKIDKIDNVNDKVLSYCYIERIYNAKIEMKYCYKKCVRKTEYIIDINTELIKMCDINNAKKEGEDVTEIYSYLFLTESDKLSTNKERFDYLTKIIDTL